MCTVWFRSKSYLAFNYNITSKSPKHQPLVSLKLFQQLMLIPTEEARTELVKARLKRKWN